jgi:hypothetical protein
VSNCTFPACPHPAVAHGVCNGHFQQRRRCLDKGEPVTLSPLRGPGGRLGPEPLVRLPVRVTRACHEWLRGKGVPGAVARMVLERAAKANARRK